MIYYLFLWYLYINKLHRLQYLFYRKKHCMYVCMYTINKWMYNCVIHIYLKLYYFNVIILNQYRVITNIYHNPNPNKVDNDILKNTAPCSKLYKLYTIYTLQPIMLLDHLTLPHYNPFSFVIGSIGVPGWLVIGSSLSAVLDVSSSASDVGWFWCSTSFKKYNILHFC